MRTRIVSTDRENRIQKQHSLLRPRFQISMNRRRLVQIIFQFLKNVF